MKNKTRMKTYIISIITLALATFSIASPPCSCFTLGAPGSSMYILKFTSPPSDITQLLLEPVVTDHPYSGSGIDMTDGASHNASLAVNAWGGSPRAVLYSDVPLFIRSVQAIFIDEGLPTSDPHVVNQLYSDGGVLKISSGP